MKSNFFERNRYSTILIVVLLFVVIADVLVANIYKKINGFSFWEYPYVVERNHRINSDVYNHGFAPNRSTKKCLFMENQYDIYTNSMGFKDKRTRNVSLIPKKHRLVFIGDSFTEGIGFNYEDTFVGLIDEKLSEEGVEVLNAGVSLYSPVIYFKKVESLLEKGFVFDELVVYIDISDIQNEAEVYVLNKKGRIRFRYKEAEAWKGSSGSIERFLKNNTILVKALVCKIYNYDFERHRKGIYEISAWTFDQEVYNKFGRKGLHKAGLYMGKLHALLNNKGIKLTVAVYPWPPQISQNDLDSLQVRFWQDWCKKREVDFINYFPVFIKSGNKSEINETINKYFIRKDVHWNKEGHRKVAEIFLDWYLKGRKEGS